MPVPKPQAISFTPDYFLPYLTEGESESLDQEKFLIAERRARVASMYCSGMSIRKIVEELKAEPVYKPNGEKLGYAYNTVRDDLQVGLTGFHRRMAQSRHEHLARELLILAHRESELIRMSAMFEDQWNKSIGKKREYTTKTTSDGTEKSIKKWSECGDPRLGALLLKCQEELLKCQEMRWRLLGLLNPLDGGGGGDNVAVKIVVGIDPMELV